MKLKKSSKKEIERKKQTKKIGFHLLNDFLKINVYNFKLYRRNNKYINSYVLNIKVLKQINQNVIS